MPESSNTTKKTFNDKFFGFLYRTLPPLQRLPAKLDKQATIRIDQAYWILTLLSTLPALRAGLLFPTTWLSQIGNEFVLAGAENIFGLFAPALALIVLSLAALKRSLWGLVPVASYILIWVTDSLVGSVLNGFNNVYILSAFSTFLYFVVAGTTRSLYFLVYILALILAQNIDALTSSDRITEFVAFSVIASLIYETWRQNRPMFREFSRENMLSLIGRTFSLWSPTIILIIAGLTVSQVLLSSTEKSIYEYTFVVPHCSVVGGPDDLQIPCPTQDNQIQQYRDITDIKSSNSNTPESGPLTCVYLPYWRMLNMDSITPIPEPNKFSCPYDYPEEIIAEEVVLEPKSWDASELPFEASLNQSVDREFALMASRIIGQINSGSNAAFRATNRAGPEAQRLFSVVPETPGIKIEPCEWYQLKCQIVGMVKRSLIKAYIRVRNKTEKGFIGQMESYARRINDTNQEVTTTIRDEINNGIRGWSDSTQASISKTFAIYSILNVIMVFWLVVISIKSFLYVFSRVVFDRATDVQVDISDDNTQHHEGSVEHVQEVSIPGQYPYDMYYKSNYQPLGPAPRFSIPQFFSSMMSRLRYGTWNLSHVPMPCSDEKGLTFNSIEADYLVDWHMKEGEEVVFSYSNFVAMNKNVKLKTVISLRISSLLLGRFVFHVAHCEGGPGKLILRTRGRPANAEQVSQSIPVSRLIAWNSFARFSVDSHLTRTDVFLNGFNLRRATVSNDSEKNGILIVEADARDGGVLFGTLRFAKHFLLPI